MFTMLTLFLFTAFGIPLVLLAEFWILDRVGFLPRKRRPSLCEKCDYDLTGNESGICPECGTPIAHECARRSETSR